MKWFSIDKIMVSHRTPQFQKRAIGVFKTRNQVEKALHELRNGRFDMNHVGVIARDDEQPDSVVEGSEKKHQTTIGNKREEGTLAGVATGGVLGGITGLLVGLGTIAIPGIGPVLLAGAEATAIATTIAGTAIGAAAGGLVGALIGLGIPEKHAYIYRDRLAQGHYLIMVTGDTPSIDRAATTLHEQGIQEWNVYEVPATYTDTHETTIEKDDPDVVIIDHRHQTNKK